MGHITWHPITVTYTETFGGTVVLACRFSLIAADSLVLCVTWYQTYRTVKWFQREVAEQGERTFAGTLFYDGECYNQCLLFLTPKDYDGATGSTYFL